MAFKFMGDSTRWWEIAEVNPQIWYPLDAQDRRLHQGSIIVSRDRPVAQPSYRATKGRVPVFRPLLNGEEFDIVVTKPSSMLGVKPTRW